MSKLCGESKLYVRTIKMAKMLSLLSCCHKSNNDYRLRMTVIVTARPPYQLGVC